MKMRYFLWLVVLAGWVGASGRGQRPNHVERYMQRAAEVSLVYNDGPLLTGPEPIPAFIIWYGNFTLPQRAIVQDFFSSLNQTQNQTGSADQGETIPVDYELIPDAGDLDDANYPRVADWWQMVSKFKDGRERPVSPVVYLAGELDDPYSRGFKLWTDDDMWRIVEASVEKGIFPAHYHAIYLILTASDVQVDDGVCAEGLCGTHSTTYPSDITAGQMLPFAWTGNFETQCPGACAWPFAPSPFWQGPTFGAPNGDVGMDGLVTNLASQLAATATNPYSTGYVAGERDVASACSGIFGPDAAQGDPGRVFVNRTTDANFNVLGVAGRGYLLPAIWNPGQLFCEYPKAKLTHYLEETRV